MLTNVPLTRFIPVTLKRFIKRVAAYLFPTRFGYHFSMRAMSLDKK